MDREGLVEQPFLAPELDHVHEVLGRDLVELAAFEPGIDEGAQADLGERAGAVGRDVPIEMGDDAERQVVGLDSVVEGQFPDLRDE
jgi:hypothetical protein